jgi:hypothetical protein
MKRLINILKNYSKLLHIFEKTNFEIPESYLNMDKYNDLKLIDYGFRYKRDNNFSLDDITWFLLSK